MNLNLLLLFIVIVAGVACKGNGPMLLRRYVVVISFFLVLFATLCSVFYGVAGGMDTLGYYYKFRESAARPFSDIWQQFLERYIYRTISDYDIGFILLQWIVGKVTNSYHIFKFIASLLIIIPLAKLVSKYAEDNIDICFAYPFFISLLYHGVLIGGRQIYAMGMGVMSFLCYQREEYKKAIVFQLVALTLHMSSLLMVLPILISMLNGKVIRIIHIITILLIPVMMVLANPIIAYMGNFVGVERYADYGSSEMTRGGIKFIFLAVSLSLYVLYCGSEDFLQERSSKILYSVIPIFTLFCPLIYSSGSMIRIAQYSMVFLTVLIPQVTRFKFQENSNKMMIAIIVLLSILLIQMPSTPYEFFWHDNI